MPIKEARTSSAKWGRNYAAAGDSVRDGVRRVTESPGERANRVSAEWQRKMSLPETREAYEEGNRSYTLADWQNAMINKGIPNMQSGATIGQQRWERWYASVMNEVQQAVDSLPPRGSEAQNYERSRQMGIAMKKTKKRRRVGGGM